MSPRHHVIGFTSDRYVRLDSRRYLNVGSVWRLAPCETCSAQRGEPCVVSKGRNRGAVLQMAHSKRGSRSREITLWFGLAKERRVKTILTWDEVWKRLKGKSAAELANWVIQPDRGDMPERPAGLEGR